MESDLGKLFIGGISWDTDEERLRNYFSSYGEVVEAVIMRDRATGRARGFGFIVFADPSVAERVIIDKHMIDGRPVEAKRAVPRDTQTAFRRTASPVLGSPGPIGRSKKIFVGGLPSNITEIEFKNYFNQFGVITDVVVMYDHNTQRPRGFGFITFDTEEAVERVLLKNFHELNGKMVEVKRAVPRELSPSPNRSPFAGYGNIGMNRSSSFVNNFPQGYNLSPIGGVGRFSPIGSGRTVFPGFSDMGFGLGMNTEPSLSPSYVGNSALGNNLGYGRAMNTSYFNGNSPNRYSTNLIGYSSARDESFYNSNNRELWENAGRSYNPIASSFKGSLGNNGSNWGMLSGSNDNGYGRYGRIGSAGSGGGFSPFSGSNGYRGPVGEMQRVGMVNDDSAWQPSSGTELDGPTRSFAYELGNVGSTVANNVMEGHNRSYNR